MNFICVILLPSLIVALCKCNNETKEDTKLFEDLNILNTLKIFTDVLYNTHHVHPYIKFDEKYNTKKMPLRSLPLDVNITINIKNIYAVDEVNQLLGMETTVQMNWIDDRVTLLNVSEDHLNLDRITLPPNVS